MANVKRICLWSGPRNISTALMYSFAQRKDTKVFDEPLYGHYLKRHPQAKTYHPGAQDILDVMENDGQKVLKLMLSTHQKPVLFFKHMTHHLLGLKLEFMKHMVNIILTRDPVDMLPSFAKVVPNPTLNDVGYQLHTDLIEYYSKNQIPFMVIDATQILLAPRRGLIKICEFADIPFDEKMLSWKPQQLKEDGIWAKYWYANVHKSKGFVTYQPKKDKFPEHLEALLSKCLPYYHELLEYTN